MEKSTAATPTTMDRTYEVHRLAKFRRRLSAEREIFGYRIEPVSSLYVLCMWAHNVCKISFNPKTKSHTFHLFAFVAASWRGRKGANSVDCCCWHRQIDEKRKIINLRLRAAFVIIHDIFTEPCTNYTQHDESERGSNMSIPHHHLSNVIHFTARFCRHTAKRSCIRWANNKLYSKRYKIVNIVIIFALTFVQSLVRLDRIWCVVSVKRQNSVAVMIVCV